MRVRFVILIVAAAALAILFAVRVSFLKTDVGGPPKWSFLLQDHNWNCEKTDIPAELSIRLEVDTTGKKNRLYYSITEAHGFFVETLDVTFYYKPTPETTQAESPYSFDQFLNMYVPADGTLKGCMEVVPRELELAGAGDSIGTSENWGATVIDYHSACTNNPDPLPPPIVLQCRD